MDPSGERTNLTSSVWGLRRRHPTHVRIGEIDYYSSSARGSAPDAVGLRLLDARGVRLHPDAQLQREVKALFVRQPELSSELMDPDLRCQSSL